MCCVVSVRAWVLGRLAPICGWMGMEKSIELWPDASPTSKTTDLPLLSIKTRSLLKPRTSSSVWLWDDIEISSGSANSILIFTWVGSRPTSFRFLYESITKLPSEALLTFASRNGISFFFLFLTRRRLVLVVLESSANLSSQDSGQMMPVLNYIVSTPFLSISTFLIVGSSLTYLVSSLKYLTTAIGRLIRGGGATGPVSSSSSSEDDEDSDRLGSTSPDSESVSLVELEAVVSTIISAP